MVKKRKRFYTRPTQVYIDIAPRVLQSISNEDVNWDPNQPGIGEPL